MGTIERDFFSTQKDGDVTTYYHNGRKVTKEEFDKRTAEVAKKIKPTKKHFSKSLEDRKKSMMEDFKKGGIVKRYKGGLMVKPKAAKRGY